MKKLICLTAIICGMGLAVSTPKSVKVAKAEEELSSVVIAESSSEEIASSEILSYSEETSAVEDESFFDDISQVAKDAWYVIENILKHPITIFGGSTISVGFLLWLLFAKIIPTIKTKKTKELFEKTEKLLARINSQEITIEELYKTIKVLGDIANELLSTVKNENVKENVAKLLLELKPVKEEAIDFAKVEGEKLLENLKKQAKKSGNEILDILNK